MRILLVEDDKNFALGIQSALSSSRRFCDVSPTCAEGISMLDTFSYDVVLLDLTLPEMSGIEFIQRVRRNKHRVPIIVLSGQGQNEVVKNALDEGADDFVQKPSDPNVLESRINAVIRRSLGYSDDILEIDDLVINRSIPEVTLCKEVLHLTGKEFTLLELMALRKNKPIVKSMFLDHLYGGIDEPEGKIVDVYVCKVRKKMSDILKKHERYQKLENYDYIRTVWGRGYVLASPLEKEAASSSDATPTAAAA